jgi:hypothetical protein
MNFMIKLKKLEEKELALENENNDMKKRVMRGIETIESYKHNIPCKKEKEMWEEYNKLQV